MIRRRMLLAGIAAGAVTPVFAQSPSTNRSETETQYMKRTLTIGSLSLAVSRIALMKASNPKLKEFAQFEVAEQETIADVLKSIQTGSPVSGTVKSPSDAELQENLDANGREMLQKTQSASSGPSFDRDYLKAQTDGHRELLQIQEDYLKSGKVAEVVNTAKLARGQIKEHLQLLADVPGALGSVRHSRPE